MDPISLHHLILQTARNNDLIAREIGECLISDISRLAAKAQRDWLLNPAHAAGSAVGQSIPTSSLKPAMEQANCAAQDMQDHPWAARFSRETLNGAK